MALAMSLAARAAAIGLSALGTLLLIGQLLSIIAVVTSNDVLYADAAGLCGSFCHQLPSRCPWVSGSPTVLCFRCIGLYSGVLIGPLVWNRLKVKRLTRLVLCFATLLPSVIEYALDKFLGQGQAALLRWTTGVLLGAGSIGLLTVLQRRSPLRHPIGG